MDGQNQLNAQEFLSQEGGHEGKGQSEGCYSQGDVSDDVDLLRGLTGFKFRINAVESHCDWNVGRVNAQASEREGELVLVIFEGGGVIDRDEDEGVDWVKLNRCASCDVHAD